jgi:hydroxyacylglutathione hydrolase
MAVYSFQTPRRVTAILFRQIFEPKLAQYAYLLGCQRTGEAIVVDPMRDVDQHFELAAVEKLRIVAAADTHIHADYVSGLREFAERGVKVYASDEGGPDWRYDWLVGSSYLHQLLRHGDTFRVGNIHFRVLHTPGHTPEHLCFEVTDVGGGGAVPMGVLTGDFVFVGDVGRPDLLESAAGMQNVMEPSARALYRSLSEFKRLPEYYQVWPAHGAGSACGKTLGAVPSSTVGYELRYNPSIQQTESEGRFVKYILAGQPEPPLYFARMKRVNKLGPAVLGKLPQPRRITSDELLTLAGRRDVALIDTSVKYEFLRGHIPASISSPWNKQFNTVAGCYVDESTLMVLLIEERNVREAVRELVNVGLDNVVGYATFEMLDEYRARGGKFDSIEVMDIMSGGDALLRPGVRVLDVRGSAEYELAHLPWALNIAHTRLAARLAEVPTGEKLYVHCGTGSRSVVAAAFLKRHGFDVVFVDGDFETWIRSQEVYSSAG